MSSHNPGPMEVTGNIPFFGIWYEAWTSCCRAHGIYAHTEPERVLCEGASKLSVHYPTDLGMDRTSIERRVEIREKVYGIRAQADAEIRALLDEIR